jgi:PAS domain S-box-containing protein
VILPENSSLPSSSAELDRAWLKSAIMAVPESVFLTNAEGCITFVNAAFTEQTGYEPLDVQGVTPRILSSGLMPDGFFKELWATILSGQKWRGRILNRRLAVAAIRGTDEAHDELYWVEASITPVLADTGKIDGFITIQRDITEEVRREQEADFAREAAELKAEVGRILQQQQPLEERFSTILRRLASTAGANLHDSARVFLVNKEARALEPLVALGSGAAQLETVALGDEPCGRVATTGELLLEKHCASSGAQPCGFSSVGSHGHLVLPLTQASECLGVLELHTLFDWPDTNVRLSMLTHISDQMAMAIAEERVKKHLNAARVSSDEAARVKANFLANMSHEIRTPMNGVIGMTQLLMKTDLDPGQIAFARNIMKSGRALLALIDDVLDFSKLEAGKMTVTNSDVNFPELLEELQSLLAPAAAQGNVELTVIVDKALEQEVRCDPHRVRQLLTNLVGNAIKFSQDGRVSVQAEWRDGRLRCEIQDTGIGIEERRLESIFESFTQADVSTVREYGGTGLGLAICREIAQLLGGELGVESEVGVGSTFWFEIPVERGEGSCAPQEIVSPELEPRGLDLHVLIADDNAVNRTIAAKMLERLGCTHAQAEDGEAAVEAALSGRFDLVLMDIHMPNLDGLDATRAIREAGATTLPIIAMTAMASAHDGALFEQAGMDGLLRKPTTLEDLRRTLIAHRC